MIKCQVCSQSFETEKSLHIHLKKHGLYQAEYYCTYYPRHSVHYKQKIPFLNKKQYFSQEFIDFSEFLSWENSQNKEMVKAKCVDMLNNRISEKKYTYAPFHNEIKTLDLPPISIYKKYFSSYNGACKLIGKEPIFNKGLPKIFTEKELSDLPILVDTREQDPLPFKNSRVEKLFVGDYLLDSGDYSYTFVDRKSENDFLGTLSSGIERFEKEIKKTVDLDGYLFVVVESSIEEIKSNHKKYNRKTSLEYVFHNMRSLTHKYARHLQFVFTGNRDNSLQIIPKILYHGKILWQVDLQYFIDYELGIRFSKAKKESVNQ